MSNKQISTTWKQLDGLNADTAEAQGWSVSPREYSPQNGWAVEIRNPKGQLVAWGYRPFVGNAADVIRQAQAAYAQRMAS